MDNPNKIRVVFMGTSPFAEQILASLISAEYNVIATYTQPDKKVGRSQELQKSAVKIMAEKNNIPVFEPNKLDEAIVAQLRELDPDITIVAAYGKILPENILNIPKYKSLNVHASLLPKYRGASPIQNAILNGDNKAGITIMLMDSGMDTGDILSQSEINVNQNDTTEILSNKLADIGSELLLKTLPNYIAGKIEPEKQDESRATFCQLIKRDNGLINWNDTAENIYNKFRAFQPWPGVYTFWENNNSLKRLKLTAIELQTENSDKKYAIGEVFKFNDGVAVQAGAGIIILKEVQLEGKNNTSIKNFLNGYSTFIGSILK